MKSTLSQRIQARLAKMEANPRTKNRADFLANKDDVFAAIADRWSMKVIWETLSEEGRVKFSYQAFTQYVKKYTPENQIKQGHIDSQLSPKAATEITTQTTPAITKAATSPSFVMEKSPSKDNLL